MNLEQHIVRFFGLAGKKEPTNFYFLGLSAYGNGYETEFDRIIEGVDVELSQFKPVKIGLTKETQIAEQRKDINTIVGNVYNAYYNGILFLPRPNCWCPASRMESDGASQVPYSPQFERAYMSIAVLLRHTGIGLIAFNLDYDFTPEVIEMLANSIWIDTGKEIEIVNSPARESKAHIFAKNN